MHKTDNAYLAPKLELRRYFLRKYHADGARVFDGFQGSGVIWNELKKTENVASYWGVDLKKKKGRLKVDSLRVVGKACKNANVIDLDAYGSPWSHYKEVLRHHTGPTTIFLTIGQVSMGISNELIEIAGLGKLGVPKACKLGILPYLESNMLALAADTDIILESQEAFPQRNARYVGLHIKPR